MDSGNSSSMQSSSGGDEEHDSRADSISAFLNPPGGLAGLSHYHHPRIPTTSFHHHHPPHSSVVDPFSIYLQEAFAPSAATTSTPLPNLDMTWPHGAGAADPPSCTDVASLMGSAPLPSNTSTIPSTMAMAASRDRDFYAGGVSLSSLPPPLQQQPSSVPTPAAAAAAGPVRSSKKRSRASRRASTTVLTTDTSNFRAMVQEFTGLPAPPFSSSPFPRTRFDLLHAAASSVMRSSAMADASPHYLLRPFAQQLPALSSSPFALGSSSSVPSLAPPVITGSITNVSSTPASNATTNIAATATTSTSMTDAIAKSNNTTSVAPASAAISTSTLPSDLGLETQHHGLSNMYSYPTLVRPTPSVNYSSVNKPLPIIGSKKAAPGSAPTTSQVAASLVDYTVVGGLRHGHADAHLGTFPSSTEPTGTMSSQGCGGAGDDLLRWVDVPPGSSSRGDQGHFRPAGGSCAAPQRGSSCKMNFTGTVSSECHAEKSSENVFFGLSRCDDI